MTHERATADIRGLRVGIVGMARSGVSAAKLVARHGGSPFVSDSRDAGRLTASIDDLELVGIPYEAGGHTDRVVDVDFMVVSPGVPLDVPVILAARARGIPVYSELELGSWFCRAPVVAVTGSNGKTTTTTLIGRMLEAGEIKTAVCGNIGLPFTSVADVVPADGVAVVEASSFQLETIDRFRPRVALILNLQPDHLDRHGSFESYVQAKLRIAENQLIDDILITNRDDAVLRSTPVVTGATRWSFSIGAPSDAQTFVEDGWLHVVTNRNCEGHAAAARPEPVIRVADIALPGRHNLSNAAAACLACAAQRLPAHAMAEALREFRGVEHRIEFVAEVNGVRYVNDSKATNVDAACVALAAMDRPTVLLLGGRHKGSPYTPLLKAGRERLKVVVALGESRRLIADDLGRVIPVHLADDLDHAVAAAAGLADPGDVVLLSPACASFDMFDDYEHRGRAFKEAVARLDLSKHVDEETER